MHCEVLRYYILHIPKEDVGPPILTADEVQRENIRMVHVMHITMSREIILMAIATQTGI